MGRLRCPALRDTGSDQVIPLLEVLYDRRPGSHWEMVAVLGNETSISSVPFTTRCPWVESIGKQ